MKKILIIDDDEFFRKFYTGKLEEAGYAVVLASNGEEGLKKIKDEQPDLVLLDIIMPKMYVFELLHAIAEKKVINSAPILIFSTLDQAKDLDEAKQLGAVDAIKKDLADWNSTLAKISSYMPH